GHGRRADRRDGEWRGLAGSGNWRRAAARAIGEYSKLRGVAAVRVGDSDRGVGNRRPAVNLLVVVLILPLAAFLAALAIPRGSSASGSRMWALVSSLAIFAVSLALLLPFDPDL